MSFYVTNSSPQTRIYSAVDESSLDHICFSINMPVILVSLLKLVSTFAGAVIKLLIKLLAIQKDQLDNIAKYAIRILT